MVIENKDIGIKCLKCLLYCETNGIIFSQIDDVNTCLPTPLEDFRSEGEAVLRGLIKPGTD
ncbi:unnamed protein product [marine sediment metagenome]|uniref:Uncharacterized protein n=1 Tax=marine sediment metagenome TaxID=412755 RepID=X1KTJ4_9ZZZZ